MFKQPEFLKVICVGLIQSQMPKTKRRMVAISIIKLVTWVSLFVINALLSIFSIAHKQVDKRNLKYTKSKVSIKKKMQNSKSWLKNQKIQKNQKVIAFCPNFNFFSS